MTRPHPLLDLTLPALIRGGYPVLGPLSLSVFSGEIHHLYGPNGVGKSSLLRAIVGLLPVNKGSIQRTESLLFLPAEADFFAGETAAVHHNIWQMFENSHANPDDLPPLTEHFLNDHRLGGFPTHARVNLLSSGMQQRVRLSRLLFTTARLWVLDEPWQHLDTQAAAMLDDLCIAHKNRGGGIIFTDHAHRAYPFDTKKKGLTKFLPDPAEDLWPF